MLARLLLSLSLPIFSVIGDEDLRLKCNWAQGFTDFNELLANEALQEQIMLMASEWEGNFVTNKVGVDLASAITITNPTMDFDTGYILTRIPLRSLPEMVHAELTFFLEPFTRVSDKEFELIDFNFGPVYSFADHSSNNFFGEVRKGFTALGKQIFKNKCFQFLYCFRNICPKRL
jgi:hypothetical protein